MGLTTLSQSLIAQSSRAAAHLGAADIFEVVELTLEAGEHRRFLIGVGGGVAGDRGIARGGVGVVVRVRAVVGVADGCECPCGGFEMDG